MKGFLGRYDITKRRIESDFRYKLGEEEGKRKAKDIFIKILDEVEFDGCTCPGGDCIGCSQVIMINKIKSELLGEKNGN